MAQVTPNTSYNVIKVSSVGLQGATGAPGPTGSLQSSNSGSFSITGSLIVSGSNTFTNVGPAIFSGSVTSTSGFTGSLAGTATTASYINPTFISASAAASGFGGSGGSTNTGSLLTTGSVSGDTLTFTKGDNSTFDLTVNTFPYTGSAIIRGNIEIIDDFGLAHITLLNDGDNSVWEASAIEQFYLVDTNETAFLNFKDLLDPTTKEAQIAWSSTDGVLRLQELYGGALSLESVGGILTTGSLKLGGGATGSLQGTASFATSASYALTASYALNGGGGGSTNTGSLMVTGSATNNVLTFTKGDGSTFNLTVATGSGSGGSTFPFSGSAVITGSLIISGTLGGGTGDTKGLQISNNGSTNLRVNSNTGTSFATFEGQTTQMYLVSNNSLGGTQVSNMFFNTTFSGMGDGSGLGFINFAQASSPSNDSFGSIRTYLRGVDKSEVRIYSQIVGVGTSPDISFISGSLIDVNRKIETDQDIEITDSSKGIILRSPNGTRYRITINDSGILVSGSI